MRSREVCSVVGCDPQSNRMQRAAREAMNRQTCRVWPIRYYNYPVTNLTRRAAWIKAARGTSDDDEDFAPTRSTRVCSLHFKTGKPGRHASHVDWAPSLYLRKSGEDDEDDDDDVEEEADEDEQLDSNEETFFREPATRSYTRKRTKSVFIPSVAKKKNTLTSTSAPAASIKKKPVSQGTLMSTDAFLNDGGDDPRSDGKDVAKRKSTLNETSTNFMWKEHREFLAAGVLEFAKTGCQADASVSYADDAYKVHRLILSIFLPNIRKSLETTGVPKQKVQLDLSKLAKEAEDVRALLEFMYTGTLTIAEDRVQCLRHLAGLLRFEGLMKTIDGGPSAANGQFIKKEPESNDDDAHDNETTVAKKPRTEVTMRKPKTDDVSTPRDRQSLKDDTVQCLLCVATFDTLFDMSIHFTVAHPNSQLFECEKCDFRTTGSSLLYQHTVTRHRERSHKCKQCPLAFYSAVNLRNHIEDVHDRLKVYRCQQCPKRYMRSTSLKIHIWRDHSDQQKQSKTNEVATDEPASVCPICHSHFAHFKTLKMHIQKEHDCKQDVPVFFQCRVCAAKYVSQALLDEHVAVEHNVPQSTSVGQCTQCYRNFGSEHGLRIHMTRKHSGARPNIEKPKAPTSKH